MRPSEARAADAPGPAPRPPGLRRIALAALAVAAAVGPAAAGEVSFTPHLVACSADSVRGVAAADLDGDGDVDVIGANLGRNEVAWYESTPAAHDVPGFIQHVIANNRRASSFAMTIDMNGDGRVDIISSSVRDDEVTWYENDGGSPPSFTAHVVTVDPNDDPDTPPEGFADAVRAIDVADLDGDGDLDVCSASVEDDRVAWFENTGDPGGAWIPRALTSSLDGARAVRAADLDGDGDQDISAGGWFDGRLLWFENQGGTPPAFVEREVATFLPDPAHPGLIGQFWEIVAADPDADGDTDLAAVRQFGGVEWYENDGASPPLFTRRVIKPATSVGKSIQPADLDQDGDTDFVVGEREGDLVAWHENLGGLPPAFVEHTLSADPDGDGPLEGQADGARYVIPADVDADGDLDVVWGARDNSRIGWIEIHLARPVSQGARRRPGRRRPRQSARVSSAPVRPPSGRARCQGRAAGGLTAAVFALAAAAPPAAGQLTHTHRIVASSVDAPLSVHPADIDGDGDLDVVSANLATNEVAWYESTQAAHDPPGFIEHIIADDRRASGFAMGIDMNADGLTDIISASINDDEISWYENSGGSPPSFVTHVITVDPNDDPDVPPEGFADAVRMIDVADFDGDGDLDVCSASVDDDTVAWFENPGEPDGRWTPRALGESLDGARAIHAADLDGDGDTDIVAGGWYDDRLLWFENHGGAPPAFTERVLVTFPPAQAPEFPGQVWRIRSADVDGDGDLDPVAVRLWEGVEWYENAGGSPPSFSRRLVEGNIAVGMGVDAADLDQDGDIDILVALLNADEVSWYENLGGAPPAFVEHTLTQEAVGARSVMAGDLDGDGVEDVIWAGRGMDRIGWEQIHLQSPAGARRGTAGGHAASRR